MERREERENRRESAREEGKRKRRDDETKRTFPLSSKSLIQRWQGDGCRNEE